MNPPEVITEVAPSGLNRTSTDADKPKRKRPAKKKPAAATTEPKPPRAPKRTLNQWARENGTEKALKLLDKSQRSTLAEAVRFDPVKAVADAASALSDAQDRVERATAWKVAVEDAAAKHLATISGFTAFAARSSPADLFKPATK